MKRQRHLQKISAGISLVILSLGFSFLGLLSFFNKPHADLANVPCVDSAYRIAASAASLLAGKGWQVEYLWCLVDQAIDQAGAGKPE
jgi:hypothetical protein